MKKRNKENDHVIDYFHSLASSLKKGDIGIIERYVRKYTEMPINNAIEWDLARLAADANLDGLGFFSFPGDLVKKPSGAVLAFIVAQKKKWDISFPYGLQGYNFFPHDMKTRLASAWNRFPACTALRNASFRKGFVEWLVTDKKAVGHCLCAEVNAPKTDEEILEYLFDLWKRFCALDPEAPNHFSTLARNNFLKNRIGACIRTVTARFHHDPASLLSLLRISQSSGDWKSVFRLSEWLQDKSLSREDSEFVLACRIAALSNLNRDLEAVEAFNKQWLPLKKPYPVPGEILPVLWRQGAFQEEKILISTSPVPTGAPEWLELTLKRGKQPPDLKSLEAWGKLYEQDTRDERVLLGFSRAMMDIPAFGGSVWKKRMKAHWMELRKHPAFQKMAWAYLVFLSDTAEECIDSFKQSIFIDWIREDASFMRLGKHAVKRYMLALRKRKKWEELSSFLAMLDNSRLFLNDDFEYHEFIRLMAGVSEIPDNDVQVDNWLYRWEKLIALDLDTGMLMEVMDHFIRMKQMVQNKDVFQHHSEYFEDVSLQMQRRINAWCEHILQGISDNINRDEKNTFQARLKKSSLEGSFRVLLELETFMQRLPSSNHGWTQI